MNDEPCPTCNNPIDASLKVLREEIATEKQRRKAAEKTTVTLRGELARLAAAYGKESEGNLQLKSQYARQGELLDSVRSEISPLKLENHELWTLISELESKNTSLSDINEKLNAENSLLSDRIASQSAVSTTRDKEAEVSFPCGSLDLDLVQTFSQELAELFYPPYHIVNLGSGPFSEDDFDEYLRSLRITPCSAGCPWLIVGREGWTKEALDTLIDNADFEEVRVFSQELFVAGILTTHDPFSLPTEILMKFADGHPALEYLLGSGFIWPEIVIEEDYGEPEHLRGSCEGVEMSPLGLMGYHVGITRGLRASSRRKTLKAAYQGEIPEVPDADYMDEWGRPGRSKRLWRMAHHLAWLIRSNKTKDNHEKAIRDWKDDLDWLKEQFYTNRMRFKWPHG